MDVLPPDARELIDEDEGYNRVNTGDIIVKSGVWNLRRPHALVFRQQSTDKFPHIRTIVWSEEVSKAILRF